MSFCITGWGAANAVRSVVQQELQDDAGGNRHQYIVTAGLHPVVAARRRIQVMAAPVIDHILAVAVFGTTISPYLFFWQASQEVEEQKAQPGARPLRDAPDQARANFRRITVDTTIGMGFSNIVAYFIMLTTAVTLGLHGVTDIQTSAQAASALRPIAGEFAFWLFSAGIIGTGMLAVPVLAGSAAYAMAGAFHWKNGLEIKPLLAKKFYGIIAVSTAIGVVLCFTPIDPIKALYWSAVINGVISVPIHGCHDADGGPSQNHGAVRDRRQAEDIGLGLHRGHGARRIDDVLDLRELNQRLHNK